MDVSSQSRGYIGDRSSHLQSMRGIGALFVTIGHAFTTMSNGRIDGPNFELSLSNSFLALGQVVFQPNTAVIFFYVLSGLVLGESIRRHAHKPQFKAFIGFVIRRICRLFPAMWASVLLAAAVLLFVSDEPLPGVVDGWFNVLRKISVTPESFLITSSGLAPDRISLNPVLWSIRIEILVIPALPLLVYITSRSSVIADLLLLVVLSFISIYYWSNVFDPLDLPRYLYCFYLGLIIPKLSGVEIVSKYCKSPRISALSLVALLLIDIGLYTGLIWMPYKFLLNALISGQLLIFVTSGADKIYFDWLRAKPLVAIGNISFSIYVYSLSIQILIVSLLISPTDPAAGNVYATIITLITAIATTMVAVFLSHVSWRYIEQPGITIGRRWSGRFD